MAAISGHSKLVLLGNPGAGKFILDECVIVRQDRVIVATSHSETTDAPGMHRQFFKMTSDGSLSGPIFPS